MEDWEVCMAVRVGGLSRKGGALFHLSKGGSWD